MNPIDTLKALRVALDLAVERLDAEGHPATASAQTTVRAMIDATGESPDERKRRLARDRKRRQRDKRVTNVTPPSVTQRDTSVTAERDSVTGGVGGVVFDSKALFGEKTQESKAFETEGAESTVDSHARESVTNERDSVTVTRKAKRDRKRDSVTVTLPDPLNTPAFHAAWAEWLAYRTERRLKPWVSATIRATYAELLGWGEPLAVAAIKHSIAKGYQGIYLPPQGLTPTGRKLTPVEEARAKRAEDTDWSGYRGEAVQ